MKGLGMVLACAALGGALVPVTGTADAAGPRCRPPSQIAPREGAAYSTGSDQTPRTGRYLTRTFEQLEPGETTGWDWTRIGRVSRAGDTFAYDVTVPIGIRLGLEVRHLSDGGVTSPTIGLYLREIAWRRDADAKPALPLSYGAWARAVPADPLKIMGFPVQSGSRFTSAAPDVGEDHQIVDGVARSAIGVIQSDVTVGFAETVEVCDRLAQAWKIHWDVEVRGELPFRMFGTFWIATQWGGWPIRGDVIVDHGGGYAERSWRLMRLRPGWY